MQYRHEVKYRINYGEMLILKSRLDCIAKKDPHAINGEYKITSLYFDNINDKALLEKLNGASKREKFRLRYYNDDLSNIKLEKKCKNSDLGYKASSKISEEEVRSLLLGDLSFMPNSNNGLILDLYSSMVFDLFKPKSVVIYDRIPYTYEAGNVRVTLDYNIRTTNDPNGFLDKNVPTIDALDNPIILEVKWDNFLPEIIQDAVNINGHSQMAYSKYAASRMYD